MASCVEKGFHIPSPCNQSRSIKLWSSCHYLLELCYITAKIAHYFEPPKIKNQKNNEENPDQAVVLLHGCAIWSSNL